MIIQLSIFALYLLQNTLVFKINPLVLKINPYLGLRTK